MGTDTAAGAAERPVRASDVEKKANPLRGEAEGVWRSRIVGHGDEDPEQLLANPRNWRIHPGYQQDALAEALDKIGWVQNVVVNTTTGHVVDGHLRVALAMRRSEPSVPVTFVELTEDEEALALATLDPIASLAATDDGALKGLLGDLEGELDGQLAKMMSDLAKMQGSAAPSLPSQDDIDRRADEMESQFGDASDARNARFVDVTCPHCAEEFAVNLADFDKR